MEHSWRPRPPPGNFCPVCSNSHFPFCHPPLPQYFRPPPPPPPPHPDQFFPSPLPPPPPPPHPPLQSSYDPFVDHQGPPMMNPYPPPPPPPQIPPRPWNSNPNFSKDYYGNVNPALDYDSNGQIGVKRMRDESYVSSFADEERRLKLIRDHGAASQGLDRNYDGGYRLSSNHFDRNNYGEKRGNVGDHFQGIEGGYLQEGNSDMRHKYVERQFAYQHSENNKNVEIARSPYNQSETNLVKNQGYRNGVHGTDGYRNLEQMDFENAPHQGQRRNLSTESRAFDNHFSQSHATHQHVMNPKPAYYSLSRSSENVRPIKGSQGFNGQPPLPTSPPPPLPAEPPGYRFSESVVSSSASGPNSLFPVAGSSASSLQSQYTMVSEAITSSSPYSSKTNPNSRGYYPEEIQGIPMPSSKTFVRDREELPPQHLSLEKPKVVNASHILKHPHRASRPDHIVIILRGLPGSGKSYLAKILRDLEVENGGTAPRIHSMDEYFMMEVEKVEDSEGSRSNVSVRGRKQFTKTVMEYCYEPEMEEAYRSSMLKAFKKTLDEGAFPFVIVDDRNLRVADFAQFWATAKRSGYEVYILEATYKDPAGCAARNVHRFTQNDIHRMAAQWEEAPSLYMKLDIKSLLHGDDLEENGIQEVDMDTEDGNDNGDLSGSEDANVEKVIGPSKGDLADFSKDEKKWDGAEEHPVEVVKELGKSKWSNVLDDEDVRKSEVTSGNSSALSSLTKSYSNQGKSVRWADQVGRTGFSIGSGKASNVSLVIGPGSGYNSVRCLYINYEGVHLKAVIGESRMRNMFQEQLRAERESFKAVFDKRKQRIRGIGVDDE
ncbi:hypothetical protein BUALT_Bualt07G0056300 [Buddleja alternifolia]|uniref:YLP motif-containing protein 1 n=1 Tax=Buddleja alternifolia TaxID=168488 RepID=A0AAV6X8J8_9LAMI|nr:hypothetical protein BUALT_Bualt07G0056300 [Buddleja alternifolia]